MAQPDVEANREETLDYLRRAYASTREWYGIAERKAQLVLGANGILVTVVLGSIFGKVEQLHALKATFQLDTWILITLAICAIVGAVACAGLSMWSLHGRTSAEELRSLRVRTDDGESYGPAAHWYFGHLALLETGLAKAALQQADSAFEVEVLAHHLITLSWRVLRKYKFVNRAWSLTSTALILTTLAAFSIILHA